MNKLSTYLVRPSRRYYCSTSAVAGGGRIKTAASVKAQPQPQPTNQHTSTTTAEIASRDVITNNDTTHTYLGQPSPMTHGHVMKPDEVTIGIRKDEYAERRHKLMYQIKRQNEKSGLTSSTNLVVLPASSTVFSAPDVPYPFRQESNFFYLTGYQEPNSCLVIEQTEQNDGACKSTLFVSPKDPHKELWEGPRAGLDGARALTGVDSTAYLDDLKSYLADFCSKFDEYKLRIFYDTKFRQTSGGQNFSDFAKQLFDQNFLEQRRSSIQSPYKFIHELRWRKSAAEIGLMRKASEISAQAFVETMRFSYPRVDENLLLAKFDFESRLRGARCLAYPPVVAGGSRANTIHYLNADQLVHDNELVLMDAGVEYGGYVSDITRNWPVNGKFTAAQRELYDVLYDVQMELIKFAAETRPVSLRDIFLRMLELLTDRLTGLGLVPSNVSKNDKMSLVDDFCPHHVSHYLGLDVHDTETVSKSVPLPPGTVITIEPGLYFKPQDKSVPERYRGIGMRIEDDIVITDTGVDVLSSGCPKSRNDIEQIMSQR